MADITISIPTDKVTWVLDGFAKRYNYQTDIPNPDFDDRVDIQNPAYDPNVTIPNPAFDDQIPEDPETNPSTIPNPAFDDNQTIPNPDFDDNATLTNPESKAAFAKRFVIMFIKSTASQGHVSVHQRTVREEEDDVILS